MPKREIKTESEAQIRTKTKFEIKSAIFAAVPVREHREALLNGFREAVYEAVVAGAHGISLKKQGVYMNADLEEIVCELRGWVYRVGHMYLDAWIRRKDTIEIRLTPLNIDLRSTKAYPAYLGAARKALRNKLPFPSFTPREMCASHTFVLIQAMEFAAAGRKDVYITLEGTTPYFNYCS